MDTKAPNRAAARRTRPLQYKSRARAQYEIFINNNRSTLILVLSCGRRGRRRSANADIAGHLAGYSTSSVCRRVRHGGRPRATPSQSRSPCRLHAGGDNGIRATSCVGCPGQCCRHLYRRHRCRRLGVSVNLGSVGGRAGVAASPATSSAATPDAALVTTLIGHERRKRGWLPPAMSDEGGG